MGLYQFYEMQKAMVSPLHMSLTMTRAFYDTFGSSLKELPMTNQALAGLDVLERMTRRYEKPSFGIDSVDIDGKRVEVREEVVTKTPFCELLRFVKEGQAPGPKIMLVAPMSGHHATLLRDTVRRLLPFADIYITDWIDAREVPLFKGSFDLNDYIDILIDFFRLVGDLDCAVGVCQPSVPVLAAISIMAEDKDPCCPKSMVLMGGPIDTRRSPTAVNKLAAEKGLMWFHNHAVHFVPLPYVGVGRRVYPGFLQLTGFMTMNLDRHMTAFRSLFDKLVEGDGDSIEKHDDFYDEYLSVMDLTEEFYLQTIDHVFIRHSLPLGEFYHRKRLVRPEAITDVALFTIEGERDDISGRDQTKAAHDLCVNIPEVMKKHLLKMGVGHYGIFSGRRFGSDIVPQIMEFIGQCSGGRKEKTSPLSNGKVKPLKADDTKQGRRTKGAKAVAKAPRKSSVRVKPAQNKETATARLSPIAPVSTTPVTSTPETKSQMSVSAVVAAKSAASGEKSVKETDLKVSSQANGVSPPPSSQSGTKN